MNSINRTNVLLMLLKMIKNFIQKVSDPIQQFGKTLPSKKPFYQ